MEVRNAERFIKEVALVKDMNLLKALTIKQKLLDQVEQVTIQPDKAFIIGLDAGRGYCSC